jgi:hypothetical protein
MTKAVEALQPSSPSARLQKAVRELPRSIATSAV